MALKCLRGIIGFANIKTPPASLYLCGKVEILLVFSRRQKQFLISSIFKLSGVYFSSKLHGHPVLRPYRTRSSINSPIEGR